jgi:hypothetical protein
MSNLKLSSGVYALSFNETLENVVHDHELRRDERMDNFAKLKNKQLFPELFSNPLLTQNELKAVEDVFNAELLTVMTTIEEEDDRHLLPHGELPDKALNREPGIKYEEVHNMICFTENDIFRSPYPNENVVFYDSGKQCVPKFDFLKRLAMGKYVNPLNGKKLEDRLIYSLLSKYSAEINLIKGSMDVDFPENSYERVINSRRGFEASKSSSPSRKNSVLHSKIGTPRRLTPKRSTESEKVDRMGTPKRSSPKRSSPKRVQLPDEKVKKTPVKKSKKIAGSPTRTYTSSSKTLNTPVKSSSPSEKTLKSSTSPKSPNLSAKTLKSVPTRKKTLKVTRKK